MWRTRLVLLALALTLLVGSDGGTGTLSAEPSPSSSARDSARATGLATADRSPRSMAIITPSTAREQLHEKPCATEGLRLTAGQPVDEATGQHTVLLVLRNVSSRACYVKGYPRVALIDNRGRALPFRYVNGGGMMLTDSRPQTVQLGPGGSAYFAVNKYRCDLGDGARAVRIRIGVPTRRSFLGLELPNYRSLHFCGRRDPGSAVHVSPLVSTRAAVFHGFVGGRTAEPIRVPPSEPPQRWVGVRKSGDRVDALLFRAGRDPRLLASWPSRFSEETPGRLSVTDVAVDWKMAQAYVATCCEPVSGSIWRTSLRDGARNRAYADQGHAVDAVGRTYARADSYGALVILPRRPSQRGKFARPGMAATQVAISPGRDQVVALINPRRSSNPTDTGPVGILTVTRTADGDWRRAFTKLSPPYCAVFYMSPTMVGLVHRKTSERPTLSCHGARVDALALATGRLTKAVLRLPETSRHLSTDPSGAYLIYTTADGAVRWISRDGRGGRLACGDYVSADW